MNLIDYNYYVNSFLGAGDHNAMPQEDFYELLGKAAAIINIAAFIDLNKLSGLNDFQEKELKEALCAQTEYLYLNGGLDFIGNGGDIGNVSIGRFSMSGGEAMPILSPIASGRLHRAGLLHRGVVLCV